MDYMKRETVWNDTKWDLYCKYVAYKKSYHELAKRFRRGARHKLKLELNQELLADQTFDCDDYGNNYSNDD